jgi:hydrogenase maturation factor
MSACVSLSLSKTWRGLNVIKKQSLKLVKHFNT